MGDVLAELDKIAAKNRPEPWSITEQQSELIDFLLDPDTSKGSQNEWCRSRGIHPSFPGRWKKEAAFKRHYEARFEKVYGGVDKVQQVVDAMQRKGADGDVRAAQIYLGWVEKLKPKRDEDDERGFSDADIADEVAARREALQTTRAR